MSNGMLKLLFFLLATNICVCHGEVCCKMLNMGSHKPGDKSKDGIDFSKAKFGPPSSVISSGYSKSKDGKSHGREQFCAYLLDICAASKIKSKCIKECAAITSSCAKVPKGNKVTWCDDYNPGKPGYAELIGAMAAIPLKYCPLASQVCKLVTAAGKCAPQCQLLVNKCKDEKFPRGCVDPAVLMKEFRTSCKDKTCLTSEFCFCPQNSFQSCKSCHPGCKLQKEDLNRHNSCVEAHKFPAKKYHGPVQQRANPNPNKDPVDVFHRPDDVVVVKGRNLRRTPTELLHHPSIWRDFITMMEQAAEQ